MKINKILMPTDFSTNANQALRYATTFADKFKSKLTFFHVITLFQEDPENPMHRFPNMDDIEKQVEKTAIKRMDALTSDVTEFKYEKVNRRGISAAEEIVNFAGESKTDLIVMGTHGRSAIGHFLIGSVAEKVVRHAHCPVLTLAHQEGAPFAAPKIERILVPVDFSDHSKKSLKYADKLATVFGASLDFLHVIDQRLHPAYYVMGQDSVFNIFPDILDKSMHSLKEFISDDVSKEVNSELIIREGNPHAEIVKFAKTNKTDLILMATHGLSGLDKMLIGSTTEKVVRKANVPVMTLK